ASGQCDCIYFHNTFLEDFPIVGALIAPRPLCIFSGRKDPDFPPDGYHEVFRRVKKIYDLYGESDRVREVDDDVGHSDIPLLLKPRQLTQPTPLLIYVKRPIDSIHPLDLDELLPVLGRATVIILNPRGTEHPVTPFEFAEIERSASWIGRTVASMQVWDILRA